MLCSLTFLNKGQSVLIDLREKLLSYWSFNRWDVPNILLDKGAARVPTMKEQDAAAREQSKEAMEKKKKKRAAIPADFLTGKQILGIMKDACDLLEIRYAEMLPTSKDSGRLHGSANNFVLYCKAQGINPRQLLGDVCENWSRLRTAQLVNQEGKLIHFPPAVSFMEFFRHREVILAWLATNKDTAPKYGVKLTWEK
jgi:hypothetical protein